MRDLNIDWATWWPAIPVAVVLVLFLVLGLTRGRGRARATRAVRAEKTPPLMQPVSPPEQTTAPPPTIRPPSVTPAPPDTAEEILRQRYARGEINRHTFEQMMADLESLGHPA